MEKVEELTKWQKDEEKILIAKVLDKLKISQKRKKFENTDFLDLAQKKLIEDILIKRKVILSFLEDLMKQKELYLY